MKIALLIPGSGGTFYCQNCLRDYALVRALQRTGEDIVVVPLYLPAFNEELGNNAAMPVFFGGINVYLQQASSIFRYTPRWMDRLLDARWLLRLAAQQEGSTAAAQLGPMTLSMLKGRYGRQRKELDRLVAWLASQEKPDVIHISNALLLGLAPELKRVLHAPIVCGLQDEEPWVESMAPPYNQRCWEAMADHAPLVDQFFSTSAWYAARMRQRLACSPDRVTVVYPGIDVEGLTPADALPDAPVIGFLSRISEAQGFGVLVDAFITLKQRPGLRHLRLRATGGCTKADAAFFESVMARLREYGYEKDVEIIPEFQRQQRNAFLQSLTLLSVPVIQDEAFGTQLIEAMAAGVPVVQPATGGYPEVIEASGGGIVYDPAKPDALADALESLLRDPEKARALGMRGRSAVLERFTSDHMAQGMIQMYKRVAGDRCT